MMKINRTTEANLTYSTRTALAEEEAEEGEEVKEESVGALEVIGRDILEEEAFAFKKKAEILW